MPTLNIQRTIIPPNGFLAAARQDSIYSAANLNLADLAGKAQQELPFSFECFVVESNGTISAGYVFASGVWADSTTYETVESTDITGIVYFRNPADYDVEFVW